jgi:glycine/D-amino acid oxidase-like deaminating enzyme
MSTAARPILDALILGQGIAGTLLAWTLLDRGWALAVLDDGHASSSSRVAAGLINPVTGRRFAKTPDVDQLLPASYGSLESRLGEPLLHWAPMLRLFRSESESATVERRRLDSAYAPYLGERLAPGRAGAGIRDPLGSLVQQRTGYLSTTSLMDRTAERLREAGRLHLARIEADDFRVTHGFVECGALRAARVFFCQGYRAMDDPLWSWLPFQPAKGEILSLESGTPTPDYILNAGRWLLPLDGRRFRLGATYDWGHLDQEPTEHGRETLLHDLPGLIDLGGARVLEHRAGVRPGTLDNAPFIGVHPSHPRLWIFNGFGSKGSLQVPGYAQALAQHLENGRDLPTRVSIERYAGRLG